MKTSIRFLCSKGVVEISPNRGQNHYQVYLNRYYIGVVMYVNNEFWSFCHQVRDEETFTGLEGRIITDIAIGKVVPKTLIIPKKIIVNGADWTVVMYVPGKYEVRNERGIVRGQLWKTIINGEHSWVSKSLDPAILRIIAEQM